MDIKKKRGNQLRALEKEKKKRALSPPPQKKREERSNLSERMWGAGGERKREWSALFHGGRKGNRPRDTASKRALSPRKEKRKGDLSHGKFSTPRLKERGRKSPLGREKKAACGGPSGGNQTD